jgi:DNA modification methylase
MRALYRTSLGRAYLGDSLEVLRTLPASSVDLVVTSPPFALQRKKSYGNVASHEYCEWFEPYALAIRRVLKRTGSLVIDIAASWNSGRPTRSLYPFELLLRLCSPAVGFELAQELYWFNPSKIPGPAAWVTVTRMRVKDSVNPIWWLSKTSWPRANNRRVLTPYSDSMLRLIEKGYNSGRRPSGHVVSGGWARSNGGAIPPNLIVASNTQSNDVYLRECRSVGLRVHPARFVEAVPEFVIRLLTRPGNLVVDPFAGSNVVGAVAERLGRKWISMEIKEEYAVGSSFRFPEHGRKVWRRRRKNL